MTYPNGATTLQRATRDAAFSVQYRDYGDEQTMDHALVNRLYELLGPFAMDLKDEARGIGTPTFLQIKALAADEWGYSTPAERDENSTQSVQIGTRRKESSAFSEDQKRPYPSQPKQATPYLTTSLLIRY